MAWSKILLETFGIVYSTVSKMVYVMIPVFIAIECLKDMGSMEKIAALFKGIAGFFRLPGEASLGVIAGIFAGLVLGSGIIIQLSEEVKMSKTQINTMFILVGICHSVIEETVFFAAIGVNAFIILLSRALMALIFCFTYIGIMTCLSRYVKERNSSKAEA